MGVPYSFALAGFGYCAWLPSGAVTIPYYVETVPGEKITTAMVSTVNYQLQFTTPFLYLGAAVQVQLAVSNPTKPSLMVQVTSQGLGNTFAFRVQGNNSTVKTPQPFYFQVYCFR